MHETNCIRIISIKHFPACVFQIHLSIDHLLLLYGFSSETIKCNPFLTCNSCASEEARKRNYTTELTPFPRLRAASRRLPSLAPARNTPLLQ